MREKNTKTGDFTVSLSRDLYLGPFFRCKTKKGETTENRTACPKSGCPQFQKFSSRHFCFECGSPIQIIPVLSRGVIPDPHAVGKAVRDALFYPGEHDDDLRDGYHYWYPNARRKGSPDRVIEGSCFYSFSEEGDSIHKEKLWLEQAFSYEYQILQEAYGPGSVVISWGLISYLS